MARIAAILHVTDNYNFIFEEASPVTADAMRRAIAIGEYFLATSEAALCPSGADSELRDAKYLLKRLERSGLDEISKRDLHALCRGKFGTIEDMEMPLSILVDMNYARVEKRKTGGKGRPADIISMNPMHKTQKNK